MSLCHVTTFLISHQHSNAVNFRIKKQRYFCFTIFSFSITALDDTFNKHVNLPSIALREPNELGYFGRL